MNRQTVGTMLSIYNFPLFINEPKFTVKFFFRKFQFSFAGLLPNTVGHTGGEDKCYPMNKSGK